MAQTDETLKRDSVPHPLIRGGESVLSENRSSAEFLSQEQAEIRNWLKTVRFRKQLIGGVSEQDVWKKLEELNALFETALRAERIRYDVLMAEQQKTVASQRAAADDQTGRVIDE